MTVDHDQETAASPAGSARRWPSMSKQSTTQNEAEDRPEGQLPLADREQQVLDRIDRARRRRPNVREERITLAHGAGGKATQTLIEAVFLDAFRNPLLEPLEDAALLAVGGARMALTTDSYVVSPLFFPGGDIGDLAVNGTVNDLAVSGATPMYLSAGFILEEGFPVADLQRIVESMGDAAAAAGVHIVTGDTKVVQRGKADGCYINTAGVGLIERDMSLGVARARPGDAIIVSGPIGDHGITVMLARGELDIEADICSDTAPLNGLVAGLLDAVPGVRAMRDATRGGVATILNEIARAADVAVLVSEDGSGPRRGARRFRAAGHRPHVRGLRGPPGRGRPRRRCGPRGGRAARSSARRAAAVIGHVREEQPGLVLLKTAFGGTRIVDLLVGDPLPRIC